MAAETLTRRSLLRTAWMGAAAAAASPALAQTRPAILWKVGTSGLPEPDPIVHLVNRITFGLSPADLVRARQLGFDGFVEEQLHPDAESKATPREGPITGTAASCSCWAAASTAAASTATGPASHPTNGSDRETLPSPPTTAPSSPKSSSAGWETRGSERSSPASRCRGIWEWCALSVFQPSHELKP